MDTSTKIVDAAEISKFQTRNSSNGQRLMVARGWFDVLRASHCRALADAKRQGGDVVVIVHADSSAHPTTLDQSSRAQLVAALAAVDYVVICDGAQAERLSAAWNPAAVVEMDESCGHDVVQHVLERYRPR